MNKKNYSIFYGVTKLPRKKQTPDGDPKPYRCPKCKHIIVLENKYIQNKSFTCPNCEQKNIFKESVEQKEKKYRESFKLKNLLSQLSFNAMIIGLILTLTSLLLLFTQNPYTTKLSLTLIILAVIIPLFIIEKKQNISTMITLGTIIYIIILFSITGTDLEIFLILIFLGVLITKAVIDEYIPKPLKIRMNLFTIVFFIIFMIIVTKRIINLVGI